MDLGVALPTSAPYTSALAEGRPSFAQQQNHVNTLLRHKFLAPEPVHNLHLKSGLQKYRVK